MGPYFGTILATSDFVKRLYLSYFEKLQSSNSKFKLITPKYIIETNFDTKLGMFGLAPSTTEEGAIGPEKGASPLHDLEGQAHNTPNFQFTIKLLSKCLLTMGPIARGPLNEGPITYCDAVHCVSTKWDPLM